MLTLLAVLLSLALAAEPYFIHVTDMHLELNYTEGASVDERCVHGTGDTPPIGYVGCDLSDESILSFLQQMKEMYPEPEFILYTGDSSPHYVTYGYADLYSVADVNGNVEVALSLIREAFPDAQILPVMGNHDNFPSDEISTDEHGMEHLSDIADIFAPYLPEDAVESFRLGGYYSVELDEHTRFVSILSTWCDTMNFYADFSGGLNTCGTFDWAYNELTLARALGQKVIFSQHRPVGYNALDARVPQVIPTCEEQMVTLVNEFADVLTYGTFTGHTHTNSFRIILDDDLQATHNYWVTSAMSTFSHQNPGLNVFFRDSEAEMISDFITYYIDIDASNDAREVIIENFGSQKENWGLSDLSPASLFELFHSFAEDNTSETLQKHLNWVQNDCPCQETFNNDLWASVVCSLGCVAKDLYHDCLDSLEAGEPFIF
eukprot:gnl/Chilomastix_cuspidata/626.p1 GENE.gnl/Chilomastix_cuspidata/626~~gnl/Chilomastix_cuspidata/626.p1  ORF type:complete len:433 (-),score=131.55 gnl/Chilomastix_cuspidata/626:19-1317(-)